MKGRKGDVVLTAEYPGIIYVLGLPEVSQSVISHFAFI